MMRLADPRNVDTPQKIIKNIDYKALLNKVSFNTSSYVIASPFAWAEAHIENYDLMKEYKLTIHINNLFLYVHICVSVYLHIR